MKNKFYCAFACRDNSAPFLCLARHILAIPLPFLCFTYPRHSIAVLILAMQFLCFATRAFAIPSPCSSGPCCSFASPICAVLLLCSSNYSCLVIAFPSPFLSPQCISIAVLYLSTLFLCLACLAVPCCSLLFFASLFGSFSLFLFSETVSISRGHLYLF